MWRFTVIAEFALPSLCLLLFSCAEELPEPILPEIVGLNVSGDQFFSSQESYQVTPYSTFILGFTVEFNKEMESVSIDVAGSEGFTVVNGNKASWTASSYLLIVAAYKVTITGVDKDGFELSETVTADFSSILERT